MHSRGTRAWSANGTTRRFVVASAIAVAVTVAFLPGSGLGSSGAAARGGHAGIPAALAAAIHARLGAGPIRSGAAARATSGPGFGYPVVLSADGTTALVSAYGAESDKGAVYVFHVSDAGSWSTRDKPTATLTNKPGKAPDQFFGRSIALSADGTTAVIGAPLAGTGLAIGRIYVFHVAAEGAWKSSSKPKAALKVNRDFVGDSVALSSDGTTLVTGTPETGPTGGGGAFVFHATSEGSWVSTLSPVATLSYDGEGRTDSFVGDQVAISGDGKTAILGDSQNASGGGAYVYHVASETSWTTSSTPTAILTDANSGSKDYLGWSVALSGDGTVALLGGPGGNAGKGAVDVFHIADAADWASTSTADATLTAAGGAKNDGIGWKLALSADGTTALVSDPGLSGDRGGAQIFHVADETAWATSSTPTATLTDSGSHAKDILGDAVALSGDGATAVLGAPEVRLETGAADVFHASDATSWASTSTPNATLTVAALSAVCVVPKLKGLTVPAAKSALKAKHCRLGQVKRVHAKGKKGHVVSQSEKPGTRLSVGAKVAVNVAK